MTAFDTAWDLISKSITQEISEAINNGIYSQEDYTHENADKFQRFLRRKYNDDNIIVEYIESDEAFYIAIKGKTFKFDSGGDLTWQ
jgi:hypothetical protein